MSITVGDILRVVSTLIWLDGNLNQNVFNAVVTGSGGPYDDADIVDDAIEWVTDIMTPFIASTSDEMDGSQVQVYLWDPIDEDWDEVGSAAWVYNPTGTVDQLPRGVAALINAKSTDPDVSGKKYFGGITEDAVTDGLWVSGLVTALGTAATEWVTSFVGGTSGADLQPVVWSPTRQVAIPFSGAVIIPTIPAYQRRRKRGVGV